MENKMIFKSLMKILDYLRPILIVRLIFQLPLKNDIKAKPNKFY